MKRVLLSVLFMFVFSSFTLQKEYGLNLTKYVNPFIGTGGHGHTFPGATLPFGMVQLSPDTRLEGWDGCSGYHYSDSVIYGFSHTHLSGTGVPDYCDILFMPFTEDKFIDLDKSRIGNFTSVFSHSDEIAVPGYYSVLLKRYNVKAELTTSTRVGFHKYTFPENKISNILIDLKHRDKVIASHINIISNNSVSGFRRSDSWARDQRIYFYAVFSEEFKTADIYSDENRLPEKTFAEGKNIKAIISFNETEKPVMVKVGISAISEENAKMNLEAEIENWDFENVKQKANDTWNDYLNKIQVKSDDYDKLNIFYTALYHTAICPNIFNDVDGSYLGRDFKVHKSGHNYYTVFSLWDTYRALHPLLNLIEKKRSLDFIKTFLLQYEQGGRLPVWELGANETDCMIGYHSIPVIVDAYNSGINGFDKKMALDAMVNSAKLNIFGLDSYKEYGYIPSDKEHESVSKTLEYSFDDWCICNFAKSVKDETIEKEFNLRAQSYKNVFDKETGFMRPRYNNAWKSPFNPTDVDNNYTEANSWQYSFYVPQDIPQLNEYLNGNLEKKLDDLFSSETKTTGRDQADITGLIGQYAHGNEPSHHIAYLFNYTDNPFKTQKLVRQIMSEFYKNSPDGLIGNEDCGQMSAWYVFSAMGFYPVTPASGKFIIGSPVFEEVKINLENGKVFIIKANNVSDENIYIQNVKSEDKKPYITADEIFNGNEIVFEMGNIASKSFGNNGIKKYLYLNEQVLKYNNLLPSPFTNYAQITFRDSVEISLDVYFPDADIYYAFNGVNTQNDFIKYTGPFKIYNNTKLITYAYSLSGNNYSYYAESEYYKIPGNIKVELLSTPGSQYTAGGPEALIDGIRGKTNWRLGRWQGYQAQNFTAVLDYEKEKEIHKISIGFLQDARSWIWMPKYVEVYASNDNINFENIGRIENTVPDTELDVIIKDFVLVPAHSVKARYIKVNAVNYGKLPSWHPGAGGDAYIFVDEIKIE